MATSMLRLGRLGTLKCLQQDGWGSVRTPLTAAFCTKTEAPKKPAKKASSKKAPAAPAPAPEPEPFDNTTYKNLQHHNYNTYTFVDVDVEMAKYRLPQPSTGRPSPKH